MSMITVGQNLIQGNPSLTARVQGYLANKLSWQWFAPVLPVTGNRNFFYVYDFDFGRRTLSTKRDAGGKSPSSVPKIRTGSFTTEEDVHKTPITKLDLDLAQNDPQAFKGLLNMMQSNPAMVVGLALEYRTAAFAQSDSNYFDSSNQVLSLTDAATKWDQPTSKPKDDVIYLAKKLGLIGGVTLEDLSIGVPYHIHLALRANADVRNQNVFTVPTNVENITEAMLKSYFGCKEYKLLGAQRITSVIDAATEVNSYMWGNSVYILKRDENANQDQATDGAFFTPSRLGKVIPIARTFKSDDPEGIMFECQAVSCTAAGAPDGYGTRTAARIDNVLLNP